MASHLKHISYFYSLFYVDHSKSQSHDLLSMILRAYSHLTSKCKREYTRGNISLILLTEMTCQIILSRLFKDLSKQHLLSFIKNNNNSYTGHNFGTRRLDMKTKSSTKRGTLNVPPETKEHDLKGLFAPDIYFSLCP